MVKLGSNSSSNEYNKYKEGINIVNIILVGKIAQTISNNVLCLKFCDSRKDSLNIKYSFTLL